jgi:hypothetical protein
MTNRGDLLEIDVAIVAEQRAHHVQFLEVNAEDPV